MPGKAKNKQRTAIVYFGPERADYLKLAEAEASSEFLEYIQAPLQAQLGAELHKETCRALSRYTGHGRRMRRLQGWVGEAQEIPIHRVRCCECRAVFTVLPSFIMRYRRQDTDCLEKLLRLSLAMHLSQRHAALVYSWGGEERAWSPTWMWNLVQWLGNLMPVAWFLMRLGLTPPKHVLSDEKFAVLDGERIYLFLVSQGELIWHAEWLENLDETAFEPAIERFLTQIEQAAQQQHLLTPEQSYQPESVNTDGWKAAQNAWKQKAPQGSLLECLLHGRKRVDVTLDAYAQAHPELNETERHHLKERFDHVLAAPSLAAYSQRLRRLREAIGDEPILAQRLDILQDKRLLFTNYLKFPEASAFSSPIDRSMRFLDEKLQTFGQFRVSKSINTTLNAWAIVNNLRPFLPDAKKAGQSLATAFGAKLRGIPWMEALNLCTVGVLDTLIPSPG